MSANDIEDPPCCPPCKRRRRCSHAGIFAWRSADAAPVATMLQDEGGVTVDEDGN